MTPLQKETLGRAGIDAAAACERFLGNEDLYWRFLQQFPEDGNFVRLVEAMDAQDWAAAEAASHTLKGLCGNLSIDLLFRLLSLQVAALRGENWAAAGGVMGEISAAYGQAVAAIRQAAAYGG